MSKGLRERIWGKAVRSRHVRCGKQDINANEEDPAHSPACSEIDYALGTKSISVMHCSAMEEGQDEEIRRGSDSS